jgi:hypothetical protein
MLSATSSSGVGANARDAQEMHFLRSTAIAGCVDKVPMHCRNSVQSNAFSLMLPRPGDGTVDAFISPSAEP